VIGTGNDRRFLSADTTGFRRWLPVECGRVDLDALRMDVVQLWAEGAVLYRNGGLRWQDAQRLAHLEHEQFTVGEGRRDVLAPLARAWLETERFEPGAGSRWGAPFPLAALWHGMGLPMQALKGADLKRLEQIVTGFGFVELPEGAGWALGPGRAEPHW
jgi:hypothetical protein